MLMLTVSKKRVIGGFLAVILVLGGAAVINFHFSKEVAGNFNYRVFVAGIGTVEGKWSGDVGIAVIGLETRPGPQKDTEIKVIDLLIANNSSQRAVFNSDISLVDKKGRRYELKAKGQQEVVINPGALSQGTVLISVPQGLADDQWIIEVRGGNLPAPVVLPFRVVKVSQENQGIIQSED